MNLLGQCTLRRVLFNTHKWPPSQHSLPLITTRSTAIYRYPIGPKPRLRMRDREAQIQVYNSLLFLLRSGAARDYGLDTRYDGYLSVRKLLNYPLFRSMDMVQLQELVNSDEKYRFQLLFDPSKGDESWWIRAKLWDEKKYTLRPCRLLNGVRLAVFKTTLEEWNGHISRTGISRLDQEHISIDRHIPTDNYVDNFDDESQVFIFLDIQQCILAGLRFSYIVEISSHVKPWTPLITRGNNLGLIPPSLFTRVEMVEAKKKLLWGSPDAIPVKSWPPETDDFDDSGQRKTMLPLLPKNLPSFVDFFDVKDVENLPIHPETMHEAMEVLEQSNDVPAPKEVVTSLKPEI